MDKKTFSTNEVASICGIKLNRLNNWLNAGLVSPSIEKAFGHGTKNVFSLADVYNVLLFLKLLNLGFARESASQILTLAFSKEPGRSIPLFPEDPPPFDEQPWIIVTKGIVDGKENIYSYRCDYWNYGKGFVDETKRDFLEEIQSNFKAGSDFVFIINLSRIVIEVDQKIREL
jgi:hypothetical protein